MNADLAAAILQPSKTIAQGFVTNTILTLDGELLTGFVTNERSEQVTLRDQNGKETTIDKEEIDFRKTSEISVMPTVCSMISACTSSRRCWIIWSPCRRNQSSDSRRV